MVSVIIPSYNAESTIELCLQGVYAQHYRGEIEVILIDSSKDTTAQIVEDKFPRTHLIKMPSKTDPGVARNIGIQNARGDILIFLDADCIPGHNWLKRHIESHKRPFAAVGGSIRNSEKSSCATGYAGYVSEFRQFIPELPAGEVDHIPTCNISYKKRVFEHYGSFMGEFYPQEDLVFNYMLTRSGEKILFEPSISVSHVFRVKLKDFFRHQQRIGAVTAQVINLLKIEGYLLLQYKYIAFPLLLFVPAVKFIRTVYVFLRYEPSLLWKKPQAFLLFGLSLFKWQQGFLSYIYFNRK